MDLNPQPTTAMSQTPTDTECQKKEGPLFQCCCDCIYLRAVHYHCCTEPKPSEAERKKFKSTGRCVCGVRKGFACCNPELDSRIYDNWPKHSGGCEMHTTKRQFRKWFKGVSAQEYLKLK